jgi:hypothetical protein
MRPRAAAALFLVRREGGSACSGDTGGLKGARVFGEGMGDEGTNGTEGAPGL